MEATSIMLRKILDANVREGSVCYKVYSDAELRKHVLRIYRPVPFRELDDQPTDCPCRFALAHSLRRHEN